VQVHLIDGTFELFRAYHGAPARRAPSGQEVGAVAGLLRSLAGLLRQREVTHVACAFDHVIESFRNRLFPPYKSSANVPAELLDQFDQAEEAARALGIVTWPMIEYEADDALATAALRYAAEPAVEQVVICSPDKDLAQVVEGTRIVTFDRIRRTGRDEAGVRERFGVPPAAVPDYLALVGDGADGLPGIPRWGARSAAAVLSRYGTIEAIPADPEAWEVRPRGAAALARNLNAERDRALLYKRLATLVTDVPIKETVDDLQWQGAPRARFDRLRAALGLDEDDVRPPGWL
jgi:5'-3' exonuclease